MVDFFVSYTGVDQAWAEWVAARLEEAGYSTRLQAWDFNAGSNFVLEMDRAVAESERTILVLTAASLAARYVRPEWAEAFRRDPEGIERRLIPVRVRKCEPAGLLAARVYIDLVDLDEQAAKAELISRVDAAVRGTDRAARIAGAVFPGGDLAPAAGPPFPGELPPVWNMPAQAARFTGRDDLLEWLETRHEAQRPVAVLSTEALHGLGGVGKTRACVEYAHRRRDHLDIAWLVNGSSEEAIRAGLASLSEALRLPESRDRDRAVAAQAARRWLERHPRWMLVLDDVPSPSAVMPFLPTGGSGQVLLTSRWSAGWRDVAEPYELDVLAIKEASRLLVDRSGDRDPEAAAELAVELGGLPLALEQAAAYTDATGITLRGYLARFREHAVRLLGEGRPRDYRETIATTWLLAFEQVEASPGARDVLLSTAFLSPEPVPWELFANENSQLRTLDEPAWLSLDQAMRALREVSLISGGDPFEMHRLVQTVARSACSQREALDVIRGAEVLIWGAFPREVEQSEHWPLCEALTSHGQALAMHAEEHGIAGTGTAAMLYGVARYLKWRFALLPARRLLEKVIALAGEDMPAFELGSAHLELADVLADLGEQAAIGHAERGAELVRSDGAVPELARANALLNLGSVMRRMGDRPDAVVAAREALALAESSLDETDARLGGYLNNLANALSPMERLPLLERAVLLIEQSPEPDPHVLAVALSNLSSALGNVGRLRESLAPASRAIELYEGAFGPEFLRIAPILANQALALRELNRLDDAAAAFRRVIEIEERTWGSDHANLAVSITDHARTLQLAGGHNEALRVVTRAVDLFDADTTDDRLAEALLRRGDIYREMGLLEQSYQDLIWGLRIREQMHGRDSSASAGLLIVLGATLRAAGHPRDAISALRRAVDLLHVSAGVDSNLLAGALNNLGNALGDIGDFDSAIPPLEQALEITGRTYGTAHPQYAGVLVNLGIAYSQVGRPDDAERLFVQAHEIDPSLVRFDDG